MKSYTKEFMVEALKKLLKKKPLSKITVNDIVTECGASKQTLYNHFQDKYELFNYALTTVLSQNLVDSARDSADFKTVICNYYSRVEEEQDFYRSFIRDDSARQLILNCIFCFSAEYFRGKVREKQGGGEVPEKMELTIVFASIGNAKLVVDWIRGGMVKPAELMAEVTYFCLPDALKNI